MDQKVVDNTLSIGAGRILTSTKENEMTNRITRGATVTAAAATMALGTATAAHAAVLDSGTWDFSYTDSFDACGFPVEIEGHSSGSYSVTSRQPGSQTFYYSDRSQYREVLTNPGTGKWAVISGHAVFKEIKATHVDGDIYTFRVHEAGAPFTLEDSNGNVVLRDRGLVEWEHLFDTHGDGQPGGTTLDFTLVSTRGPHTALNMTDQELCAMLGTLIG